MTPYEQLLDDLAAEQAALDAVLGRMTEAQWDRPSHAPGWLVRDQVTHLDMNEAEARARAVALLEEVGIPAAARRIDPKARLPWYGPEMGAASFVTARLMETWSHGLDVVDIVDIPRPDTDRLRHVAFLGVRTREFSYVTRGVPPDPTPVYVELTAPSGATWTYGDATAENRIAGSASDFCRVVTQRRHMADTNLRVTGLAAQDWMRVAQAFAGPPGEGRQPGQFPKDRTQ